MINQRSYPDIILGTGNSSQTIAAYGCFECSLLHGFLLRGYSWTVAQFDKYLTDRGAFTDNVLLSASKLATTLPEILEGRNEAWNDAKLIAYLNDKENYIILGEVSGKGIGGSGQHFVYMDRVDVVGGKITMTYIDDPWGGLEDQKVTTRYNAYGNILSLRVFKIVKKQSGGTMANMYNGYDLSNAESMKVAVDVMVRVQKGEFVEKTKYEADLKVQKEQLTKEKDVATKKAREEGVAEGRAQVLAEGVPQVPVSGAVDAKKWTENGLTVEVTEGNTKKITNYRLK